jgi:acyl-CoA dehydrogenase
MTQHRSTTFGLEGPLTETQAVIADVVERFAAHCLRPVGVELDRLSADAVIATGSSFWSVHKRFLELGIGPALFADLAPEEAARLQSMIWELLGRGDAGLAVSMGSSLIPLSLARLWGNKALADEFPDSVLGCWGLTEPDHGSDMLDRHGHVFAPDGRHGRPNCQAQIVGDELVVNGQKAAWVSNGSIAQVCALFCAFDSGKPGREGAVIYVPLDAPGVSRGKPLEKLGQRSLNQGEIYFQNVRLPLRYLAVAPEGYQAASELALSYANAGMGSIFTGVAQAAYELAHEYAHVRRQGGVPLIRHQNVRYRLFHMFRKVEASRALARRVVRHNFLTGKPVLQGCIAAKITATQTAFEVANDALQIFGGCGISRDFPIEKILRDARMALIEDGCNEFLAIKGGSLLADVGQAESTMAAGAA